MRQTEIDQLIDLNPRGSQPRQTSLSLKSITAQHHLLDEVLIKMAGRSQTLTKERTSIR